MSAPLLRTVRPDEVGALQRAAFDEQTLAEARTIVADVCVRGETAVRAAAERFGDVEPGAALVHDRAALRAALESIPPDDRALLERVAARVRAFAEAQRQALLPFEMGVAGGVAGQTLVPLARAGCYAPGGRYPLPSTVLMTAVTARVAGVEEIWVASPKPPPVTLAAAAVAGADGVLAVGGPQAIAALAYGAGLPACDIVVGPGNRWVTAAKYLVSQHVAIDMLAGPSELVVIADHAADPQTVAADLLAQAEHDADAVPILVTPSTELAGAVDAAMRARLETLPTAEVARAALNNGIDVRTNDLATAVEIANRLAPEHLSVHTEDAEQLRPRLRTYGTLFSGAAAGEVFGDYGVGPNHVLPTGGTARYAAGLSVYSFLRPRTWVRMETRPPEALVDDVARLARLERLEAHARSADARRA